MNLLTLSRRSLFHHARSHLGAILGSAVAAAVLIGALVVGDSVRESLKEMALARLGKVDSAIASNDRLFTRTLGTNIARQSRTQAATVLLLPGTAVNGDSSMRANQIQVLGVDDDFWKLAPTPQTFLIPPDGALINEALARQLQAQVGDSVVLRVQKPSQLSQDAPLAKAEDHTVALRVNVERVLKDAEFGRFGLQASQIPPFNAFVNRDTLERRAGVTNKANLLLFPGGRDPSFLNETIQKAWSPADAEIQFEITPEKNAVELRSSRVFVDPAVVEASQKIGGAQALLTYFVNELRVGERATPYSMVTAMGNDLAPDEITINQWLAEDLAAKAGDSITLKYYVLGAMRRMEERSANFKIKNIVPIGGIAADRTLMPDYPGMTDAKNCRDWDTGFPIKTDNIRDKDEDYWHKFRGTPKAFISLARGQELWSNRFGNVTALRWPVPTNAAPEAALKSVEQRVMSALPPPNVGLKFEPLRAQALAASAQGQDFGELFLSFSFFLIVAALMLMTLLFGFSIEQRAVEIGTMLAIGLSPKQVRRLLLFEGAGLAIVGTFIGVLGGVIYAKAMLAGLSTIWKSAVGTTALRAHISPGTILIGSISSVIVAVGALAWSIRKEAKRPARELLSSEVESDGGDFGHSRRQGRIAPLTAAIGILGALALTAAGLASKQRADAGIFFGAGTLLIIGGIAGATWWMRRQTERASIALPSIGALAARNIARRRKRSRAVMILLGAGAFIVAAVGVFRLDSNADVGNRKSGTGGFAWIGESSLPIVQDLNSQSGRDFYGLSSKAVAQLHFVPFRVRAGDDASCLNLNKAQKPRLFGVDPALLQQINPFSFTGSSGDPNAKWGALSLGSDSQIVPAIGDANSIQWALHARVGDTIDYEDERGGKFKVKLVGAIENSILQGSLIISEKNFIERFPTESGYRMFLIDAPSNEAEQTGKELTRALQDYGFQLTRATDRLAAFNAVQNTYINTFQVLGGLGLLLGSFGLGVVVMRNVFERRGELAVLQAIGFTPRRIRQLILGEHAALMAAGLMIGAAAAVIAVLPQLVQSHGALPLLSLGATLLGVVIFGLGATWFATSLALRGNLLESLRAE
jgi:ABC-type antimicrobial peptide transport system permease subunit